MSTITLRSYEKVGTTGATVTLRVYVYFDDPDREGNGGGVGFDDESLSRTCPNAGLARSWAPKLAKQAQATWPGCHIAEAVVEVFEWKDESFTDERRNEYVRSAEQITTAEQYGYPTDDGPWKWDDLRPPSRW